MIPPILELEELDLELAERIERHPEYPDIYELLEERLVGPSIDPRRAESTIGGHPRWIQAEQCPRTPSGKRYRLLAQLDSEPEPGWMWGDAGILYLFVAPEAPFDLRMVVQCH